MRIFEVLEETVEVERVAPHQRWQQRTAEQIVDLRQIRLQRIDEQFVEVPFPQIMKVFGKDL